MRPSIGQDRERPSKTDEIRTPGKGTVEKGSKPGEKATSEAGRCFFLGLSPLVNGLMLSNDVFFLLTLQFSKFSTQKMPFDGIKPLTNEETP